MAIFRATMLEQCCDSSKQCWNNVAMLCCAENRRCESSRVIRQYLKSSTVYASAFLVHNTNETLVLLLLGNSSFLVGTLKLLVPLGHQEEI